MFTKKFQNVTKKILPEIKIYQPIQFGIFLTFVTIKVVGEPKQQNLISAKKFVKRTSCLLPSNNLMSAAISGLGTISIWNPTFQQTIC